MFRSKVDIRVRYAETDQMKVVYYGNYAAYFEVARAESIRTLGITYKEMEAMGVEMPVVELHCKYLRPAYYDDLLTVHTELRELRSDHRIEFHHEVRNEAGKLLTSGHVLLFFLDIQTKKRATMPPELRERLLPFFS